MFAVTIVRNPPWWHRFPFGNEKPQKSAGIRIDSPALSPENETRLIDAFYRAIADGRIGQLNPVYPMEWVLGCQTRSVVVTLLRGVQPEAVWAAMNRVISDLFPSR